MKKYEMLKIIKKLGVKKLIEGSRHEHWGNPKTGNYVPVSRSSKEIPTGTANSIINDIKSLF